MVARFYRRCRREVCATPALELASLLTVLLVAFHGFSSWFVKLPAQGLIAVGLIFREILKSWVFWGLLAVLTGSRIAVQWQDVDNHKFILFYWLLSMTLAHAVLDPELKQNIVLFNARFFLIFIMLGAVAQKLSSASYMDASFFEFELLFDRRFRGFVTLFGIDPNIPAQARELLDVLKGPYAEVEGNVLQIMPGIGLPLLAKFVTWYDLIIQAIIGVAFIFRRRMSDLIGHIALLTFIVTAYFAAPVIGFAWTLIIFGILLARDRYPNLTMAYILMLVVTSLYKIPWAGWIT
jgi:hypothetical protein